MLGSAEKSHAIKDGVILFELEVGQPSQAVSCFSGVNKTKSIDFSGQRIQLQGSITIN